jgi:small subunit ribosomal protein S20
MKTSAAERLRNRAFRSQLRDAVKDVRTETNKDEALKKLKNAISLLDKAAGMGVIHRRNADRNKSRLSAHVSRLG